MYTIGGTENLLNARAYYCKAIELCECLRALYGLRQVFILYSYFLNFCNVIKTKTKTNKTKQKTKKKKKKTQKK